MNTATSPRMRLTGALRRTAARLAEGDTRYQWSHQGHCNCGQLAQTLTRMPAREIHQLALQKAGDWAQHAIDYCPTSGLPIDHVIGTMLAAGLSTADLEHLERLSDRRILRTLPPSQRALDYRRREDVVTYLRAWAALLDARTERTGPATVHA